MFHWQKLRSLITFQLARMCRQRKFLNAGRGINDTDPGNNSVLPRKLGNVNALRDSNSSSNYCCETPPHRNTKIRMRNSFEYCACQVFFPLLFKTKKQVLCNTYHGTGNVGGNV